MCYKKEHFLIDGNYANVCGKHNKLVINELFYPVGSLLLHISICVCRVATHTFGKGSPSWECMDVISIT